MKKELEELRATCARLEASNARLEAKLDALIEALASEDEEQPSRTLDGEWAGAERDQTQGLG